MERGPADFLPAEIRDVLKRKSSRDPASRFTAKLHVLLAYADQIKDDVRVGLGWISDDEFRMNKTVLANVIGIKLNTLNVNLRDLNFQLTMRGKDGWTHWKRPGFTRTTLGLDTEGGHGRMPAAAPVLFNVPQPRTAQPLNLGGLSSDHLQRFFADTQSIWSELFQCNFSIPVNRETAIERAAARFRCQEQPLQNAREVIEAIIQSGPAEPKLTFIDFCRFLAMFGPEQAVMLKIAALLTCSNETGKWLTFERGTRSLPFAAFDEATPNCLVVHHADGSVEKVYNNPTTERMYLIDEFGKLCKDWDEWFANHPVRQGRPTAFDRFSYG